MKKFYETPEFLKWKFELIEDIAVLSLGGELGDGDEWSEGDEDGDTID